MKKRVLVVLMSLVLFVSPFKAFADYVFDESGLTVFFLDVGQGDSSIIICDGEVMMIDGGDSSHSQFIFSFLRNTLKIPYIDVMVATHPHADHVGGLAAALNACPVGVLFTPIIDYDTKVWNSVLKYAEAQGTPIFIPYTGDEFPLGNAMVKIIGPVYYSDSMNNLSLVLRIEYGDVSLLFMGDAEWEEEHDLLESGVELSSDVLRVGHHGSSTSTSEAFLSAVAPEYAVISVGEDNTYNHPDDDTLEKLITFGCDIKRTDHSGTIICHTDGVSIEFATQK